MQQEPTGSTLKPPGLIERNDHSTADRRWTELSLSLTVMFGGGNGCVEDGGEDERHVGAHHLRRGDVLHAGLRQLG